MSSHARMPVRRSALLISADSTFAKAVVRAAENRKLPVRHVSDLARGLSLFERLGESAQAPSQVIFDLDLPDGPGELVLAAAEVEFPRAALVALSGDLAAPRACALVGRCLCLPRAGLTAEAFLRILERTPPRGVSEFADAYGLSAQERAVLFAIVEGCSLADVASRLQCRPTTVKTYMQRMFAKTGRGSRCEVLSLVIDWLTSHRRWQRPMAC